MHSRLSLVAVVALLAAPAAKAQPVAEPPTTPGPQPAANAPAANTPRAAGPSARARRSLGGLLRMNLDFGGDKVAELSWTDGDTTTIKAGQLVTFSAGAIYQPAAPFAIEATVGYKFDGANASNGSVEFRRIPLDLIASFAHGRHRIGAGPTLHVSPTYECDSSIPGCTFTKIEYENAVGGIVQYAYALPLGASPNAALEFAVRYTLVQYEPKLARVAAGVVLAKLDASAPGFLLGLKF